MRTDITILLFVLVLLLSGFQYLDAQPSDAATIEGRVLSLPDREPLQGVHVFLSGSKIGTVTDSTGSYKLYDIPPGAHRLTYSTIGYERLTEDILVEPRLTFFIDRTLRPHVYEMDEIVIQGVGAQQSRDLDFFLRLFVGESVHSHHVEILNPEVLRFDRRWWGVFTAHADAPIRIVNHALGYKITYYLNEFRYRNKITRWKGEPHFEEMEPESAQQLAEWKENRKAAFYGSQRHFLLTLINNRLSEEGYELYRQNSMESGRLQSSRERIVGRQLVNEHEKLPVYRLNYYGWLEINYTREYEDLNYVRTVKSGDAGVRNIQQSFMQLRQRPITIDKDGIILEPYGATLHGYFGFHRIADKTPREYRPENFSVQNSVSDTFNP